MLYVCIFGDTLASLSRQKKLQKLCETMEVRILVS